VYDYHLAAVNTVTFIDQNRRFVSTSGEAFAAPAAAGSATLRLQGRVGPVPGPLLQPLFAGILSLPLS
jgi:hypothetical protein